MSAHYRPSPHNPQRTPTDHWGLFTTTPQTVFPDAFDAEGKTPLEIVRPLDCRPAFGSRLVHRATPWWAFVFVDGACSNNGRLGAQGGWAVEYGPPITETGPPQVVSGPLEEKGPLGGPDIEPTSNRAELRASIAALRLGDWRGDGFMRLVIATDSAYVVDGATNWSRNWVSNGWRSYDGAPVKNRDLWELLLGQVSYWDKQGLVVQFWKIPRELNQEADSAAKAASQNMVREPEFVDWVIRDPPAPDPQPEKAPVIARNGVLEVLGPDLKPLFEYKRPSPNPKPPSPQPDNDQAPVVVYIGVLQVSGPDLKPS